MLHGRHVLVFVHHEVLVLFADRGRDVGPITHDANKDDDDVLEINDGALGLDLLIGPDERGDLRVRIAGHLRAKLGGGLAFVVPRRDERDLRPLDLGRAAALATRLTFDSLISGTRPPIAFGQK